MNAVHKQHLRDGAALRLIERNERGVQGQIDALDARLGMGKGAAKERARLTAQLEPTPKPKVSRQRRAKKTKAAKS